MDLACDRDAGIRWGSGPMLLASALGIMTTSARGDAFRVARVKHDTADSECCSFLWPGTVVWYRSSQYRMESCRQSYKRALGRNTALWSDLALVPPHATNFWRRILREVGAARLVRTHASSVAMFSILDRSSDDEQTLHDATHQLREKRYQAAPHPSSIVWSRQGRGGVSFFPNMMVSSVRIKSPHTLVTAGLQHPRPSRPSPAYPPRALSHRLPISV